MQCWGSPQAELGTTVCKNVYWYVPILGQFVLFKQMQYCQECNVSVELTWLPQDAPEQRAPQWDQEIPNALHHKAAFISPCARSVIPGELSFHGHSSVSNLLVSELFFSPRILLCRLLVIVSKINSKLSLSLTARSLKVAHSSCYIIIIIIFKYVCVIILSACQL